MRKKISVFAATAALILAGIAGWAASTTHARVDATVTGARIDPIQMTTRVGLQVEEFEDYSLVYH